MSTEIDPAELAMLRDAAPESAIKTMRAEVHVQYTITVVATD